MSASFYTTAVYGFHFTTKSLEAKSPNPKFNPQAPFDPKTCARIPQFITESRIDDLIREAERLGFAEASTTDCKETFIGVVAKRGAANIGEGGGNEFSSLQDFNLLEVHSQLAALASKYGIDTDRITFHAVGRCSY
jgi:hypothetical protein